MSRTTRIVPAGALAALATAGALLASGAAASAATSSVLSRSAHRMLGVVPAGAPGASRRAAVQRQAHRLSELAGGPGSSSSTPLPLLYHGGGVVHTNTTYAIFWLPAGASVSSGYESTIDGFFSNVATASGSGTNVFAVDTQYSDGSGAISYSSAFGGSYVDTKTPIPDDCSSRYTGTSVKVTGCVTDADVEAEVSRAIAAAGWTPGPTHVFLLFTPRNVGSCFTGSSSCAYTYYCAYHSAFEDSQHREVLYANQPYTDTSGVGAAGVCDSGQHPNGDLASDSTINVASHEVNETLTDPFGTAWWDANGEEIGDKCAWNFGTGLGSTASGEYNQAIGSGHYYLQQEWSNAASGCVLSYNAPAPSVSRVSPGEGAAGTTVTITGKNLSSTRSVTFNGSSASFTVKSAGEVIATVPAGAGSGPLNVTTAGGGLSKEPNFIVLPAIASVSPTSATAGTTVTITGTGFTGASAVLLDGVKVPSFSVVEAGKVTFVLPASAKSGRVKVRTPSGSATSAATLTVLPSVSGLSATSGKAGAWVTIDGSGLGSATGVSFGGVSAKFSVLSVTQVQARVPAGAGGEVLVTTPLGAVTSPARFTLLP